jgi:hypothetical protein
MKATLWIILILSVIWIISVIVVIANPNYIFGLFGISLGVVGAILGVILLEIFTQA